MFKSTASSAEFAEEDPTHKVAHTDRFPILHITEFATSQTEQILRFFWAFFGIEM